jgi:hypothetical protein
MHWHKFVPAMMCTLQTRQISSRGEVKNRGGKKRVQKCGVGSFLGVYASSNVLVS